MIAKQRNWEKLQLLVMNYKFSNRELILLKALTAIVLLFAIIYGTSYVSNEITKSKNSLFSEVNKFNETKQLLAQIKVLENNKNLEVSANDFLKNLSENNISFEQKGDSTVIPGLSKLDALEIMTNIEENNVAIESFTFSVEDSSSIILSINFDG